MTASRDTPSPKGSAGQRIRDLAEAYPEAVAIGAYALVSLAALVAAYLTIFTSFAGYDDEGTLLVTLKAFVGGHTLYRDIWSIYGPFYYEVFGGLFSLTGHPVSTDASRTIVSVLWVAVSLLLGLTAQRLTGRLALGIAGMVAAFAALLVLSVEPMHPQGLCVLLIATLTLTAVSGLSRRLAPIGAACGALLAALLLTKVNLGVFAIAAVVFALALTVEPLRRRRWVSWTIATGFLLLPLVLLNRDLDTAWVREFLLLEVLAGISLIVAALTLRPRPGEDHSGLVRWLLAAVAGFAVGFVVILGVIVLTGPSLGDVYDGIVKQAFELRNTLKSSLIFPPGTALNWAVFSLAAAILAVRFRAGARGPSIWAGLLRLAAGAVIWLTLAQYSLVTLNPSSGNPDIVPMFLAWVAVIPPVGAEEGPYKRFLRLLLPALAVAETLQVYPVAGSQMRIAAAIFVPVGALCIADGLTDLRAWSAARGGTAPERFGAITAVATTAVAAMLALNTIVLPGISSGILYHEQPKLPLPGAKLLHIPASGVATYTRLVGLLQRNGCTTFIGLPNINSLYLWSGIEAPAPQIPNGWVYAATESQQLQVLRELRASPRPCLIRNEELAAPYQHYAPPPDTPLVRYVLNDFRPVAEFEGYEFLLPKRSATAG